jgi:Abortive infection alpha
MPRKPRQGVGVSASADAKIEAIAKASYERKRTITEVIPPDVTRAKAGAWLDLISPFTEWAGLRGDELRSRRELLRLQREDVLVEIATRARSKLGSAQTGRPIPNKFLVPFLEQASLEDPDSSLVDIWAGLLVSASEKFESHHTHFVSIIGQLSAKQGEIFRKLIGTDNKNSLEIANDNIRMWLVQNRIRSHVQRLLYDHVTKERDELTAQDLNDALRESLNHLCIVPVYVSLEDLIKKESYEIETEWSSYKDSDEVDYSILDAVGLIRRVDAYFGIGEWEFELIYYHLTELGYHFAMSCGIVSNVADQETLKVSKRSPD